MTTTEAKTEEKIIPKSDAIIVTEAAANKVAELVKQEEE